MKIKNCFVTNSSSTSFIIVNKTNKSKTLVDFVKENPQLIEEFVDQYDWYKGNEKYNQENLIISAKKNNLSWGPNKSKKCIFGDEDGSLIGQVFDYILRDGGSSKSFTWRVDEYLR